MAALGDRHRAHPAGLCASSAGPYRGIEDLDYPFHDHAHIVTRCGRICFQNRRIKLSTAFAGQVRLASFMHYDLAVLESGSSHVECADNPFGAKVLPISPE